MIDHETMEAPNISLQGSEQQPQHANPPHSATDAVRTRSKIVPLVLVIALRTLLGLTGVCFHSKDSTPFTKSESINNNRGHFRPLERRHYESTFEFFEQSPRLTKILFEFSGAVKKSSLGNTIIDLVNIRASQINGCAFCLDMHAKKPKFMANRNCASTTFRFGANQTCSQRLNGQCSSGPKPSPNLSGMAFPMSYTNAFAPTLVRPKLRN